MKLHITIRSEHDEVVEFESEQPVLHVDMPAGRFLITVRAAGEADGVAAPVPPAELH